MFQVHSFIMFANLLTLIYLKMQMTAREKCCPQVDLGLSFYYSLFTLSFFPQTSAHNIQKWIPVMVILM